MQIKRLVIENFKSIERIELIEPNPFTVFVGPNGSGKSNIFEALEFVVLRQLFASYSTLKSLFGGENAFARRQASEKNVDIRIEVPGGYISLDRGVIEDAAEHNFRTVPFFSQLVNYTRLFVGNERLVKLNFTDDGSLSTSASNLETVLKRLLKDDILKREIHDWLSLFIPSFKNVEVVAALDGKNTLLIHEQDVDKPFTKELISDGTFAILAMLTAVYQSDDEPQFLCIEEPENGLHPQVARELVDFFRLMCEERGHYIWLNTHSPYMVSRVKPEELVVVDKVNGATQVKQFRGQEFNGMRMDEAWLTNVLNGGKAW